MLTLLLAPDAHIVIGLALALLLMTAAGALVAARPRGQVNAPSRAFTPAGASRRVVPRGVRQ
jgi:hypothetical protein